MKSKKSVGLIILLLIYIIAIAAGIGIFILFDYLNVHYILSVLIADIAATVIVWASGMILKTVSTYDPYWSVQTLIIISYY